MITHALEGKLIQSAYIQNNELLSIDQSLQYEDLPGESICEF